MLRNGPKGSSHTRPALCNGSYATVMHHPESVDDGLQGYCRSTQISLIAWSVNARDARACLAQRPPTKRQAQTWRLLWRALAT